MTTELEVSHEAGYAVIKAGYVKEAVSHEAGYAVIKAGYVKEAVSHVVGYAVIRAQTQAFVQVPQWEKPAAKRLEQANDDFSSFQRWVPSGGGSAPAPIVYSKLDAFELSAPAAKTSAERNFHPYQFGVPPVDPVPTPSTLEWLTEFQVPTPPAVPPPLMRQFPVAIPVPDPVPTPVLLPWLTEFQPPPPAERPQQMQSQFPLQEYAPVIEVTAGWMTEFGQPPALPMAAGGLTEIAPPVILDLPFLHLGWMTPFEKPLASERMKESFAVLSKKVVVTPVLPFRKPFSRGYLLT